MKHILFVDDDLPVLEALRVRLHRLSREWQMVFVESGPAAIGELERGHFDVIVSDMRMPGMDGADLLRIVSERWPDTIRIILSGFAELQQAIRLVPYAHQYYNKPCEPQQLEHLISRCLQLHALLHSPSVRTVVGRINKLPAMPRIYSQLRTLLASDTTDSRDVAQVISADAAMTAKVLQLVNSAFFRLARRITNVEQAVNYLGFNAIRNLTLSIEIFSDWPAGALRSGLNPEALQSHVQAVATATRALTQRTPIEDDSWIAALLHDIGYWVLAQECPQDLARSRELAAAQRIPLPEAEAQVIGASHAEIGAYLLGIWGLPYPVVEAVAHHHAPLRVRQTEFDVLAALAVSHALAPGDDTVIFGVPLTPDPRVDAAYLASLQSPINWDEACARVAQALQPHEANT